MTQEEAVLASTRDTQSVRPSRVETDRTLETDTDAHLVAVLEDDPTVRRVMRLVLEKAGFRVQEFSTGLALLDGLTDRVDCVCVDLHLEDVPGEKILRHLAARDPDLPAIVVTAETKVDTAVRSMRAGAYDYVTKPVVAAELTASVQRACERRRLARRVKNLESVTAPAANIVGDSPKMTELMRQLQRIRESDVTVCIFGESGTGKELVARAVHDASHRAGGPFVAINCAAIPSSLQESELFGHERGAFTGATHLHKGRFEQAHRGTLFLDELGEMSPETQAALLRTLEQRSIRRVGGTSDIGVDVRIVCATHRDLRALVEAGRFREDLYFRLVVYPVVLPPLRERTSDIPLLVAHFVKRLQKDVGRAIERVHPDALTALSTYRWPGNVRELQNVIHRSMLACNGPELRLVDLPFEVRQAALPSLPPAAACAPAPQPPRIGPVPDGPVIRLDVLERQAIEHALRATGGNVGKAAKALGIGRATLYRRIATFETPLSDELVSG